jgi:hypothetical protein
MHHAGPFLHTALREVVLQPPGDFQHRSRPVHFTAGRRVVIDDAAGTERGHPEAFFFRAKGLLHAPAFHHHARLQDILVGFQGKLVCDKEERPRHLLKSIARHDRHLIERTRELNRVCADLPGIRHHCGMVLRVVLHLTDEPVGNVPAADVDARSCVPEPSTQARLDGRPLRIEAADHCIGRVAVCPAKFRLADDLVAEAAEVARPRERCAVG